MAVPYLEIFLGIFALYLVYSVVVRLDPRYPIAGALILLVATAVTDAAGATTQANTLAEYVFLLLAGGVLLLLVDHARRPAADDREGAAGSAPADPAAAQPAEAADEREGTAEEPLDRRQEQLVAVVDAPRREDAPQEADGEREDEEREREEGDPGVEEGEEDPDGEPEGEHGDEGVAVERMDAVEHRELDDR